MDPFGVREVLQGIFLRYNSSKTVSIPLKSGRCCKYEDDPYLDIPVSQSL